MSALVLILSTDPEMKQRLRRIAESEGADTVLAVDNHDAMRLFALREPDITLLDVDAEVDSALELCRDMKKLLIGRRLVVVVLAPHGARLDAFAAGCDAFVPDSTDPRPIVRTVRRFMAVVKRPRRSHDRPIELSS